MYIAANEFDAQAVYRDFYALYGNGAIYFPAREIVLYDIEARNHDIAYQRLKTMDRLLAGDFRVCVSSAEAAAQFIPPPKLFGDMAMPIAVGDTLDLQDASRRLAEMGFARAARVEARGAFAVRGGILDVYPIDSEYAARVELFDDEVDSIRLFDAATQRSVERAERVRIIPARDVVYRARDIGDIVGRVRREAPDLPEAVESDIGKFADSHYFPGMDRYLAYVYGEAAALPDYLAARRAADGSAPIFVLDDPARASQRLEAVLSEHAMLCSEFLGKGKIIASAYKVWLDFPELMRRIPRSRLVAAGMSRSAKIEELTGRAKEYGVSGKAATAFQGNVGMLMAEIRERVGEKWTVMLLTNSGMKADRLFESLLGERIPVRRLDPRQALPPNVPNAPQPPHAPNAPYAPQPEAQRTQQGQRAQQGRTRPAERAGELDGEPARARSEPAADAGWQFPKAGFVNISAGGALSSSFEYPDAKLMVISDAEFQSPERRAKKGRKAAKGARIEFFTDLAPGDFVVHQSHGVGVYAGLEQLKLDGAVRDYLKLRYRDGDYLYIPTSQLDLIQKYIGSEGRAPKVDSLGSGDWAKTKKRVKESLKKLAAELIVIYSKRRSASGYAFSKDTVWQGQFEEQFPYTETADQLQSVEEIKRDMESPRIMDRLLCGDVGFGKTEVAIRAVFKAVSDGAQVAFLAPTTVLAQQHYLTFTERFRDFPISIDVLSRFRTAKEKARIADSLRNGTLDVIIGTHRMLGKDIGFKNLRLLIVDEEQRFGVTHKEKLKLLKPDVDVLSMSATPIPRTLHMSMTKIRDISVLKEPPEERFPVQTFVMEYDEEVVRDAILREVARGGQVFYLYNRVMGIDVKMAQLKSLLPDGVHVAFAHGRMGDRELEDAMIAFIERRCDVLVCTTIIESGLDMPNVNTIIVEDADRMGLAQLYQLRGRVGRSNRLAYAYITHRRDKALTEESEKRLKAIKEFTELGSGFKIAMRDMEIRGIGNLLGVEQHGHMESVGYDMYCRLLDEAVRDLEREARSNRPAGSAAGADGAEGGNFERRGESAMPDGGGDGGEITIDVKASAYLDGGYIEDELQRLEIYQKIAAVADDSDASEVMDELLDRFGDPPKEAHNLVKIARIKALAKKCGIASVIEKNGAVTLNIAKESPPGREKLMAALRKFGRRALFGAGGAPHVMLRPEAPPQHPQLQSHLRPPQQPRLQSQLRPQTQAPLQQSHLRPPQRPQPHPRGTQPQRPQQPQLRSPNPPQQQPQPAKARSTVDSVLDFLETLAAQ
jgi:transcription-repair coupling factor (superfamily II helicase)